MNIPKCKNCEWADTVDPYGNEAPDGAFFCPMTNKVRYLDSEPINPNDGCRWTRRKKRTLTDGERHAVRSAAARKAAATRRKSMDRGSSGIITPCDRLVRMYVAERHKIILRQYAASVGLTPSELVGQFAEECSRKIANTIGGDTSEIEKTHRS